MIFWLGTHKPHWLGLTSVPLFISARGLRRYKTLPKALGPWALDSGGFSELSMFGMWETTPYQYVREVQLWSKTIGCMQWAAIQDWMCEPQILALTGLTIKSHQYRTVQSYLTLRELTPELPWVPVLQGWHYEDYLSHLKMYKAYGVDLLSLPLVGIGSVCRRQHTAMVEDLILHLYKLGVRLHGFGFKTKGLERVSMCLTSADSLAWSYGARFKPPLGGCEHKNCANCFRYAMLWRESLINDIIYDGSGQKDLLRG